MEIWEANIASMLFWFSAISILPTFDCYQAMILFFMDIIFCTLCNKKVKIQWGLHAHLFSYYSNDLLSVWIDSLPIIIGANVDSCIWTLFNNYYSFIVNVLRFSIITKDWIRLFALSATYILWENKTGLVQKFLGKINC